MVAQASHSRSVQPSITDKLAHRFRELFKVYSAAEVAAATGYNPETVRRYLNTGDVPAHFIATVVQNLPVSSRWLICGKGKMWRKSPASRKRDRRMRIASDPLEDRFAPHQPTERIVPTILPKRSQQAP